MLSERQKDWKRELDEAGIVMPLPPPPDDVLREVEERRWMPGLPQVVNSVVTFCTINENERSVPTMPYGSMLNLIDSLSSMMVQYDPTAFSAAAMRFKPIGSILMSVAGRCVSAGSESERSLAWQISTFLQMLYAAGYSHLRINQQNTKSQNVVGRHRAPQTISLNDMAKRFPGVLSYNPSEFCGGLVRARHADNGKCIAMLFFSAGGIVVTNIRTEAKLKAIMKAVRPWLYVFSTATPSQMPSSASRGRGRREIARKSAAVKPFKQRAKRPEKAGLKARHPKA